MTTRLRRFAPIGILEFWGMMEEWVIGKKDERGTKKCPK
jgi:hypothetical protein